MPHLLLFLLLVLLTACGGPPTARFTPTATVVVVTATPVAPEPTTTPTPLPPAQAALAAGWQLIEKPAARYAIALPPGWERLDTDNAAWDATFEEMKRQNPQMATLLEASRNVARSNAMVLTAADLSPEALASDFLTNLNVQKTRVPAGVSADEYLEANLRQLEGAIPLEAPPSRRSVTLSVGEGTEVTYRYKLNMPQGQAETVLITQYFVMKPPFFYTVTFSTNLDQADKYAPLFEQIGQTFHLTP